MNRAVLVSCFRIALFGAVLQVPACTAPAGGPVGLAAEQPYSPKQRELALFGQFVGDWECEVTWYPENEPPRTETGAWHFAWVLEGRAVQDVWRIPAAGEPRGYGTTVRLYDPSLDAWRVTWHGVLSGTVQHFIARPKDGEIVMELQEADVPSRWIFSGITPNSFQWRAVESSDGGKTWKTLQEMRVRRQGVTERLSILDRDAEPDPLLDFIFLERNGFS